MSSQLILSWGPNETWMWDEYGLDVNYASVRIYANFEHYPPELHLKATLKILR